MDLPTCPSCGQSVLDDDATDCPFCGAAMDGTAAAKKPKGQDPGTPAKKPAAREEVSNDPFAIEQAPTAKNVVPCAPKPMKGRLHRVICPMCDTPGFIPKGAIGRQVKCANKKCLVPIFAAADGDPKKPNGKTPARVSDEAAVRDEKIASASAKNPMVMWGIVGAVLLAATLALVSFLNRGGVDSLPGIAIELPPPGEDEPDKEPVIADTETTETSIDVRKRAVALMDVMINTARVTSANRDKAFCRRLTGDAYLHLGMPKEAADEFEQMNRVAAGAGRKTNYYRVGPLVGTYWRKLGAGETQAAAEALAEARSLVDEIPESGAVALESGIELAAALVNSGDLETAATIIAKQQRDQTVASQMDTVKLAAWSATSAALQDTNKTSLPPLQVFAWHEPLNTAVAAQLAIMGQWDAATKWAASLTEPLTASDTFAIIAEQMVHQKASEQVQQTLQTEAVAKGADVALRTDCVLARAATAKWQTVSAAVVARKVAATVGLGGIEELINSKPTDLNPMAVRAEVITDYVIAAVKQNDNKAAVDGLGRLFQVMTSEIPPTAEVRAAATEVEMKDDEVQERIATELRLNDSEIRPRFIAYRRGVDRMLKAAEARRFALLQMLARIVNHGGLEVVRTVLAEESKGLSQEVGVDHLNGLLFVAAAANDQEFAEMTAVNPKLAVRLYRADPSKESIVMRPLMAAWHGYLKNSSLAAAKQLESANELRGLRAATLRFIAEKLAAKADSAKNQIAQVSTLKDELLREQCLITTSRILSRRGMMGKTVAAVNSLALTPTQQIGALYGAVRGAIDFQQLKAM